MSAALVMITTDTGLTKVWRKSLDSKETIAIVSVNLSKAFDTCSVPRALLLAKLRAYGLGQTSIELLGVSFPQEYSTQKLGTCFMNGNW